MYTYEEFSDQQIQILSRYVTNTDSNVFAIFNLPEVIKGALFSKYSRSTLGLRSLLLKEFILNEATCFSSITQNSLSHSTDEVGQKEEQFIAIKKAQNFYDRILDGYGDDSIGELGGAHLAIENVSMLAAKILEDSRIGGSPLEKSTRYIYFDQKVNGEYMFYREPILMASAYRDIYIKTCHLLFETYSNLIPPLTEMIGKKFPQEPGVSQVAYTAALRAKVLDCLRGLLPASTLTNMGVYGNGRFFETLIQKLNNHSLAEMQNIGGKAHQELSKVIPSFVRRGDLSHKHQKSFSAYLDHINHQIAKISKEFDSHPSNKNTEAVSLIDYDKEAPLKVASSILFNKTNVSLKQIQESLKGSSDNRIEEILNAAASGRQNRRHKSPRGLEHASFTFEIMADFGIYRDLQRHRLLTQDRQLLSCDFGYYIPPEIQNTEWEAPYCEALEEAKKAYDIISLEFPEEVQYIVPMAYNIRWYFHINLRSLQWLCELRSSAAGHPGYRYIAQEMARQVCQVFPCFEVFFQFVDYEGHDLGRLEQESRKIAKMSKNEN
ncbi:MAG: FAD-dependent thymidylate synthase [Rhabdochlamydiaceae bacterium]